MNSASSVKTLKHVGQASIYYIVWQMGLLHLDLQATVQAADWFAWNLISMQWCSCQWQKGNIRSATSTTVSTHYSLPMLHTSLNWRKMLPDVYAEVSQMQKSQPGVEALLLQWSHWGGWLLRVFLDRNRTACNHSFILREALQLCLIIVALVSLRLWWCCDMSSITSLDVISRWVALAHL